MIFQQIIYIRICKRMPNFQINRLIVFEELFHKLYLKHQAKVVRVIVRLPFFASSHTSNLYQVQVTNTLLFDVWHKIVKFV